MHEYNWKRIIIILGAADILGQLRTETVQQEISGGRVIGMIICIIFHHLTLDENCDRFHREARMILNAREHDSLVLRIRDIADGVHSMIGKMFPNFVLKERKIIFFLELLGETGGPVEVGLLRSGN